MCDELITLQPVNNYCACALVYALCMLTPESVYPPGSLARSVFFPKLTSRTCT